MKKVLKKNNNKKIYQIKLNCSTKKNFYFQFQNRIDIQAKVQCSVLLPINLYFNPIIIYLPIYEISSTNI